MNTGIPGRSIMRGIAVGMIATMLSTAAYSQPSARVTVAALGDLAADIAIRAPAVVQAANVSVIASEIEGVISEIRFDVPQSVMKGAVLATIDDRDANLALQLAQANLASISARIKLAEGRAKRARELLENNFASVDDVYARDTDVAVLQADRSAQEILVKQARRELAKTQITAPFSGSVMSRSGQEGAYVTRGTALFTLMEIDGATIQAELDPMQARGLRGSSQIEFESQEGSVWPVSLLEISEAVDTRSRVRLARLEFQSNGARVGSAGYLVWRTATLRVPAKYLVKRTDQLGIFALNGTQARFVVIPNAQEGRPAEVNLPADTLIVTEGRYSVNDGDQVSVSQ